MVSILKLFETITFIFVTARTKPENLEDTYGALVDEDVQNDDYDYGTGDPDSAPDEENNNVVAAEEHVEFITPPRVFVANIGDTLKLPCEVSNTGKCGRPSS